MAKIESLKKDGKHLVQVTFREPFEDMFEIAQHDGRFEAYSDAARFAEKVSAAVRENGLARSVACVLSMDHWNYVSSVYDGRYHGKAVPAVVYPMSDRARAALAMAN